MMMSPRRRRRSRDFLASALFALVAITTWSLTLLKQASAYHQSQPFSTATLQQRFSQGDYSWFSHRSSSSSLPSFLLFSSSSNEDSNTNLEPSLEAAALKEKLLLAISHFRTVQEQDGQVIKIGWGVKGKELNETSRAPQKTDFYAISSALGQAADAIWQISCNELAVVSPCLEPTAFLGDKKLGATKSPLHGAWKLLFTTAADATFDKNSTRGQAKVQNVVDASRGRITNVIDFCTKNDGTEPALKQLNVVIAARATTKTRVDLQFRYAKLVLTKFLFFPLFGRRISLYIPVPATFITRCIVLFGRLFRRKGSFKVPPVPYFEVLYLDKDLRIHKTGEDNLFVQARESWKDALPLLDL